MIRGASNTRAGWRAGAGVAALSGALCAIGCSNVEGPQWQGTSDCQPYADQHPSPTVQVTIRNPGAEAVSLEPLRSCSWDPFYLEVTGLDGQQGIWPQAISNAESVTCTAGDYVGACPADPPEPIAAGQSYAATWGGGLYLQVVAPAECTRAGLAGACDAFRQAPEGPYQLSISVQRPTGDPVPITKTISYPDELSVEILTE